MNADDFQDLQKFGNTIEKTNGKIAKKEIKEDIIISSLVKNFLKKIHSIFNSLIAWICSRIKLSLSRFRGWTAIRKNYRKIKKQFKSRNRRNKFCYKIVETKKQRGNKTVIVRRRVPFYYDDSKKFIKKSNAMYYLSLNNNLNNSKDFIPESYDCIKNSVWDFPVKEKKLSKSILFWRK